MDKVIKKISEIEATASSVMDDANKRKQAFAKEMEEMGIAWLPAHSALRRGFSENPGDCHTSVRAGSQWHGSILVHPSSQ